MLDPTVKEKIYPTEWGKVPISSPPVTLKHLKGVTRLMQKIFHLPKDWMLPLEQTLPFRKKEKILLWLVELRERQRHEGAEALDWVLRNRVWKQKVCEVITGMR